MIGPIKCKAVYADGRESKIHVIADLSCWPSRSNWEEKAQELFSREDVCVHIIQDDTTLCLELECNPTRYLFKIPWEHLILFVAYVPDPEEFLRQIIVTTWSRGRARMTKVSDDY